MKTVAFSAFRRRMSFESHCHVAEDNEIGILPIKKSTQAAPVEPTTAATPDAHFIG